MAQLEERLLPAPDDPGSNPAVGIFYGAFYCLICNKDEKDAGNWHRLPHQVFREFEARHSL